MTKKKERVGERRAVAGVGEEREEKGGGPFIYRLLELPRLRKRE